jgi:hypothetical protein
MVAAAVAAAATALPYASGMNTEKRWLPRREWAQREVARIDADLAALRAERIPSANWRRIRAKAAAAQRLRERRARLASIATSDVDDGPTPF